MPKDTTENILKEINRKLSNFMPETKYISAENAKYIKLISNDDFLFATTEKNDNDENTEEELFSEEINLEMATGNRIVIYTIEGKKFYNKERLSDIEKKFKIIPGIMKTHASFIANLKHISGFKRHGSRGYLLIPKFTKKQIPVSQTYLSEVKKFFGI